MSGTTKISQPSGGNEHISKAVKEHDQVGHVECDDLSQSRRVSFAMVSTHTHCQCTTAIALVECDWVCKYSVFRI